MQNKSLLSIEKSLKIKYVSLLSSFLFLCGSCKDTSRKSPRSQNFRNEFCHRIVDGKCLLLDLCCSVKKCFSIESPFPEALSLVALAAPSPYFYCLPKHKSSLQLSISCCTICCTGYLIIASQNPLTNEPLLS